MGYHIPVVSEMFAEHRVVRLPDFAALWENVNGVLGQPRSNIPQTQRSRQRKSETKPVNACVNPISSEFRTREDAGSRSAYSHSKPVWSVQKV
jgi:hypothetical protein